MKAHVVVQQIPEKVKGTATSFKRHKGGNWSLYKYIILQLSQSPTHSELIQKRYYWAMPKVPLPKFSGLPSKASLTRYFKVQLPPPPRTPPPHIQTTRKGPPSSGTREVKEDLHKEGMCN